MSVCLLSHYPVKHITSTRATRISAKRGQRETMHSTPFATRLVLVATQQCTHPLGIETTRGAMGICHTPATHSDFAGTRCPLDSLSDATFCVGTNSFAHPTSLQRHAGLYLFVNGGLRRNIYIIPPLPFQPPVPSIAPYHLQHLVSRIRLYSTV